MTTITKTGLAALAAVSLALTACGSDEQRKPTPAASAPPESSTELVGMSADMTQRAEPAPPGEPLATVRGSEADTSAALLRLRRTGAKVVTATLRVTNGGESDFLPELEGEDGSWYSAEGLRLVDETNGREHSPLRSPDDECLCSTDINGLGAGESADVYAKFAAPPEGVDAVSLHVPGFPSFDAIPLAP